ncbi:FMN-dependent NADH-azoreductase [Clostridiales Family XIII bacterium PM5-7]
MKKLLFIDACISRNLSRTKKICATYIEEFMKKYPDTSIETVVLRPGKVEPHDKDLLIEKDSYVRAKDWNQPMFDLARQFKEADYIVVGAPYWDLSFPSILKVYVENVVVADFTFKATENGFEGLCDIEKLVYISTAGGFINGANFGYEYFCGLAKMLGIAETEQIQAEALDIEGYDADAIVEQTIAEMKQRI